MQQHGAAGGIGKALTRTLLDDGHGVAAVDKDAEALGRICGDRRDSRTADQLYPIVADLGTDDACEKAVETAVSRFGQVEAIINNAGIGVSSIRPDAESHHPSIEELSAEIWDRFFDVNVRATMLITRAVLPHMKEVGWGRIINNTTSYFTMLRVLPYGASKAALEAMSAIWAKELSQTGITVNVLVPGGPTDTAFIADESGIPREQMLKPEIMGPPASWLISEASNGVTGQRINAARWDTTLPPAEALESAARAIGWPELTTDVVWPGR